MSNNCLALIPARGGSKGIERKNLTDIQGVPLIGYTIRCALAADCFSDVIVSTNDQEIAEVSRLLGASVPFMRPEELASDLSGTLDTVIHALQTLSKEGKTYMSVCLLQPTVPFRNLEDVRKALDYFNEHQPDSLISIRKVPHIYNPHWVFEKNSGSEMLQLSCGDSEIIPRRQELPLAYHRDGAIYISKTDVVLEEKSLYGKKIIGYEMERSPDINIDTMPDLIKARKFIEQFPNWH